MDIFEAMDKRHSVRKYLDKKLPEEIVEVLNGEIEKYNAESGLRIELVLDEPQAFGNILGKVSSFKNAVNYFYMAGPENDKLDELVGYYGEKLVLLAQQLGLNTCWAAGSYSKGKCRQRLKENEKLSCLISVGYGETQGVQHNNKPVEERFEADQDNIPDWFIDGVNAAMNAPTAVNQQKFKFILNGNKVKAVDMGGFYSQIDLGIVKYHFEIGAGDADWQWEE